MRFFSRLSIEWLEARVQCDASSFVSKAYLDLLGRAADSTALQFFSSMLDQGQATRQQVIQTILNSPEYETDEINAFYGRLLHRTPDANGLNADTQFLNQGGTDLQLLSSILASDEYFADNGGTNSTFLQAVYLDVLGRPIDPAGAQAWQQQLAGGTPRGQIVSAILSSGEYDADLVQSYYVGFLHRTADAGGLSGFTQALAAGVGDQAVIETILASDEYFAGDPISSTDLSVLIASQVNQLLDRAAAANSRDDAIIAIVDRPGHILGVRVESGVSPAITGSATNLTFAIDGALAEARTGAFFANDHAPLTSRTVQFVSDSTITQREVNSNPDTPDPNSTLYGPGFVAAISAGGHFPEGVADTPSAPLFGIENTNRDSIMRQLPNGATQMLPARFNIAANDIPPGQEMAPPESYGLVSGLLPTAQSRGIGTLPGGIPIYYHEEVVGGIGVFFPGTTGYASAENSSLSAGSNPNLPDLSLEAEWMAYAAVGGSAAAGYPVGTLAGIQPLQGVGLPFGEIDLGGLTLPLFGPEGLQGPQNLARFGQTLGTGNPNNGVNEPLFPGDRVGVRFGLPAPAGWLVTPHDSPLGTLSAADVAQIINQGIAEAKLTRAAIRLPFNTPTAMVLAVCDSAGNVLGMYRMQDATIFSEDVAVAKARNVAYYDDPSQVQAIDLLAGIPAGVAFTARTFRDVAQPFFPIGIDGAPPGPMSILNDGGTNPVTGLSTGAPLPPSAFQSALGYDAFHPNTNFHQPFSLNQNGVVFFPGSSAVYKSIAGKLTIVGGFGVSGDGVDQDDFVTAAGINGFQPPQGLQADSYAFGGVRLPYAVFPRNPLI
jgi:uncharacterized protein GlcG (DUF336 family)